jgi:hypothetical protein
MTISKDDVDKIVHAVQGAEIREGLTMCFIVVDTADGSMATFAPGDVNKVKLIEMAADFYGLRKPDANFTTAPKEEPKKEAVPAAPPMRGRRTRG